MTRSATSTLLRLFACFVPFKGGVNQVGIEARIGLSKPFAGAKCRKQRRSRGGENLGQRRVVGLQVSGGVIQGHSAFLEKGFRLPIVQGQHLSELPMGEAPGPVTFNRRILHYVTTHRSRGFSPLTGDLIGQFHGHLHDVVNLPRQRLLWQAMEIHTSACGPPI
jgi:hypothetical protein